MLKNHNDTPPDNFKRTHRPALDGMRGLAVLLVVFYHNFGFINYFFFGWLGVDLFFVLSGYLITDILLNERNKPRFLRNFYMRRVLRIFPLYYLTLFICLLILPQISAPNIKLDYYVNNQAWLWSYLQNWLYIFKPDAGTNFMHHYWSLAVEEQFYLLWPPVILLLRRTKYLMLFITSVLLLVLVARCFVWIYNIEDLAYFNLYTFTRIDGICVGCMVALIKRLDDNFLATKRPYIVSAFAAFNFLFYFFNSYYHFSFPYLALIGYTTIAMLFGLLVYEGVREENRLIYWLFNLKFLKFFGKISYGFYVFHWPVYALLHPTIFEAAKSFLPQVAFINTTQVLSSIVCTLAGIALSLISYYFFEIHFLRLKKYFN